MAGLARIQKTSISTKAALFQADAGADTQDFRAAKQVNGFPGFQAKSHLLGGESIDFQVEEVDSRLDGVALLSAVLDRAHRPVIDENFKFCEQGGKLGSAPEEDRGVRRWRLNQQDLLAAVRAVRAVGRNFCFTGWTESHTL
jgi:hypothetical protein